jgi:hypothetical protein
MRFKIEVGKNIRRITMSQRIKRTIWIVASLFTLSVAVPLYAAGQQNNKQTCNKGQMQKQQTSQMMERQTPLCSAKYLIGSDVRSWASMPMRTEHKMSTMGNSDKKYARTNEMKRKSVKIGTVKELIFNDSRNSVDCVIVASQGKYYPVPWWAFNIHERRFQAMSRNYVQNPAVSVRYEENLGLSQVTPVGVAGRARRPVLFLNITREQLREAPAISSISLERISNSELRQKVNSFYSKYVGATRERWEAGYTHPEMQSAKNSAAKEGMMNEQVRSQQMSSRSPILVTAADLSRASQVIGLKIQDPRYNDVHKIQNVLIDVHGGRLAFGLVSFGGFWGVDHQVAAVPWSALSIRVPEGYAGLDASRRTLEEAVVRNNYMWRLSERQYARQIYRDFGVTPYWQVFGFVPGEETTMSTNPWMPDSTYNKSFDKSKLTTVEGTIESVGSFYPASGSTPGTSLDVKTKEGSSVTVYAGPQSFTMQKNLDLKTGNGIIITGCKTMVNGKSVIIASELKVGGKTLTLRDQNGKPEWNTNWSGQEK